MFPLISAPSRPHLLLPLRPRFPSIRLLPSTLKGNGTVSKYSYSRVDILTLTLSFLVSFIFFFYPFSCLDVVSEMLNMHLMVQPIRICFIFSLGEENVAQLRHPCAIQTCFLGGKKKKKEIVVCLFGSWKWWGRSSDP